MYRIKDEKFIGMKIKGRRNELELTQEKLGEAIGVNYQQVQRYEKGESSLNTERLQAISLALDVPVTYFFQEENEEKINIMDRGFSYLSAEESECVTLLRKINNEDYLKSILVILRMASGNRRKSSKIS